MIEFDWSSLGFEFSRARYQHGTVRTGRGSNKARDEGFLLSQARKSSLTMVKIDYV